MALAAILVLLIYSIVDEGKHAPRTPPLNTSGRKISRDDDDDEDDDDDASCDRCRTQRALLYCGQHAARLCLPCDAIVHAAAPTHKRSRLCNGCRAAPGAAHSSQLQAVLCTLCAGFLGCAAEPHHHRPAPKIAGFPETSNLVRVFFGSQPPPAIPPEPPPDDTRCLPDLVNIELKASDTTANVRECDKFIDQINNETGDYVDDQDRGNLNDDLELASMGHLEGHCKASSSLCYDLSPCSETTTMPSLPSTMTSDNAAACQLTSIVTSTNNANLCTGVILPPGSSPPVSSSMGNQDHEPPPPDNDMEEARTKRERRQQAKQRYEVKKRNRKFGKQVKYESRKARADTRNRVKGRFAKPYVQQQSDDSDLAYCESSENKQLQPFDRVLKS